MKNKIIELGYPISEVNELIKVSKDINKDYEMLLKKYPIQYLIGYVNFYGYKIIVNENVLIPRHETEFLVEKTIKYYKNVFKDKKIDILDIGSGSGAISIVLNKEIDANVTSVDISNKALEIARENAELNNSDVNFINSDLFSNVKNKYDIIISNPPYIDIEEKVEDSVKMYEPHLALYADEEGLYFYKRILMNARKYLKDKYIIAFEIGWWQGEKIIQIAREYFNETKITLEKDLAGKDRYIFIINE